MADFFVHESAYVDAGAEIGNGTKIWHFSHVMGQAKIGRNCIFGQNVFVANHVTVGDYCKIQNNVSLYEGVILAYRTLHVGFAISNAEAQFGTCLL